MPQAPDGFIPVFGWPEDREPCNKNAKTLETILFLCLSATKHSGFVRRNTFPERVMDAFIAPISVPRKTPIVPVIQLIKSVIAENVAVTQGLHEVKKDVGDECR